MDDKPLTYVEQCVAAPDEAVPWSPAEATAEVRGEERRVSVCPLMRGHPCREGACAWWVGDGCAVAVLARKMAGE